MNHVQNRVYFYGRLLRRPAVFLLLLGAAFICWSASSEKASPVARLHHAEASQEALAEAVLKAIAAEKLSVLKDLSLSKEEFQQFVWPELPVSNPKTNVPLDYVWNDLYFRSMTRLQATFNKLKGRNLKLARVIHRGETVEYASHRAYSDMEVIIRKEDGAEVAYPLFGTLIEMDGLWKVYSYAPYD